MSPSRVKSKKRNASRKAAKKPTRRRKLVDGSSESEATPEKESELAMEWFRLLARRRGAWLQHIWMSDRALDGRATVTHAELAGILADVDSPKAELSWASTNEQVTVWTNKAEQIKSALDHLENSRFQRLGLVFGLTSDEINLLQLCAAVAFDQQLNRVCAYLQDHSGRTYMTAELATRLLAAGRSTAWTPEMNVFRWELIQRREIGVGEPAALILDAQVRDWLVKKYTLDEQLVGAAKLAEGDGLVLPEWPVEEVASWIDGLVGKANAPRLRVVVSAPRGGGRQRFASAVSAKLGMRLLVINSDVVEESSWPRFFVHAQRQVFLDPAALVWTGDGASRRQWPTTHPLFPVQFLLCEPGIEPPPVLGMADKVVRLSIPEAETRAELWRRTSPAAAAWPVSKRRRLAEHHRAWPGDIEHAAYLDADTPEKAAQIIRESSRARFGNLAQILECPFRKEDLVVPNGVEQLLEAIIFEAEERVQFWQQPEARRLFPQGRGLIALFSGPSGTGKTMSAQVIAAQLDQDLCRVNVAQLVSKWVGETPKNVEHVVRVAAENDVVLFFDEADALFARRASEIHDAQDRFANTDTAFLLQAIEGYPGVAILATNLKSNIDPAFLRRLRYLVEFPKPDVELQRKLWTKLIGALAGNERAKALSPAVELLSASADVTGAQIKFAVLAGLFAARADKKKLESAHLLIGLDRELGKEGRGLGPKERERILRVEEAK